MMTATDDEADLVARAAAGEEHAFEQLFHRYATPVARLAMAMLGDRAAAEDASQETFLRAHRSLERFRGESSFKTWLFAIANRVCIDALRRGALSTVPLESIEEQGSRSSDESDRPALELAVRRLSEDERQAFMLVDALGLSREEAARTLEIPVTTLKSRLARAHERLVAAMRASESRPRRNRDR